MDTLLSFFDFRNYPYFLKVKTKIKVGRRTERIEELEDRRCRRNRRERSPVPNIVDVGVSPRLGYKTRNKIQRLLLSLLLRVSRNLCPPPEHPKEDRGTEGRKQPTGLGLGFSEPG